MEVGGWVQVSLGFLCGKYSQSSPKPVLMFWSSRGLCVFCLYTLVTVVGYYDLSFLSMSVMVFQNKMDGVGGWGELYPICCCCIFGICLTLQSP